MFCFIKNNFKKVINKFTICLSICLLCIFGLFECFTIFAYTDVNNNTYYDFNQLVRNGNFENGSGWVSWIYGNSSSVANNECHIYGRFNLDISRWDITINSGHKYFITYSVKGNQYSSNSEVGFSNSAGVSSKVSVTLNYQQINHIVTASADATRFHIFVYGSEGNEAWVKDVQIIDLTEMFGVNNEPITTDGVLTSFDLLGIDIVNYNSYTSSEFIYISDYSNTQYQTLQSDYNSLLSSYNDLNSRYFDYVSQHSYTNTEYNELVSQINSLQNQLNQLSLQYFSYVSQHSYTNEQYETLNTQYQTLQSNYNTLINSYTDLQQRFNEVIGQSSSAMYFALNGANANLYTNINGQKTLLVSDVISINENYLNFDNSCIPNINTYLNNYDSSNTSVYPNPYCYIEIELNMSVNSTLLFTFNNTILDVDITLYSTISGVTKIYQRDTSINIYQTVVNSDRISFNRIIYNGIYMPDYINIDFSLQLDGYSYSVGYDKGVASQQSSIDSLRASVNSMQSLIDTLRTTNQQLQDSLSNSLGWKSLFFAMADTPFKVVSNILGFELFGLNLFTTFIGMITVFAIVWIIKKII